MVLRSPARRARLALVFCPLPLLAGAAAGLVQEPSSAVETLPAPLTEYMGRRIAPTMHWRGAEWLLRATRESEEHSARMLAALDVQPGDTVCDLGCGVGYLTLPLAQRVGDTGEVIAVDIQPEMLRGLEVRAQAAGIDNIRTVLGGPADPNLGSGTCDLVLMVDVYHELGYPEQVLARVRRALKPEGRLVLVEFRAEDAAVPIKPEHKMTRAQVERELSANGFRLASSFDELPWQHLMAYVSTDAATPELSQDGSGFFDQFEEQVHDGAWLYVRNCSGCHGPTGSGDGPTARELGVQPRNFNQGGFSFGNTREAMFRTISSGIPGRSVMPSFAGTLSEQERWLVVDHVRTLMPPQEDEDWRASILEVEDRSIVARGKLPPVAEGLPEHPRGLLLGLPSGLSFEFDAADVRLLAVRMGPFADREDWRDRGGGYLRPLGQAIYGVRTREPQPPFLGASGQALTARLSATWTGPTRAGLEYQLRSPEGDLVAEVDEACRFVGTRAGAAFARRFQLRTSGGAGFVDVRLADPLDVEPVGTGFEIPFVATGFETLPPSWRPDSLDSRTPWVEGATPLARRDSWVFPWFVAHHPGGVDECVLVRLLEPLVLHESDRARDQGYGRCRVLPFSSPDLGLGIKLRVRPGTVASVEAITVLTSNATPEVLAELAQEVLR